MSEGRMEREVSVEQEIKEGGREVLRIPLCADCAVACERRIELELELGDTGVLLLESLGSIDGIGIGLVRQKREYECEQSERESDITDRCQNKVPRATNSTTSTMSTRTGRSLLLGGDSCMDMIPSPPPEIPSPPISSRHLAPASASSPTALHYRRSRNPRFAHLECIVPFDAALYVSICDPFNNSATAHTPTFRARAARSLPAWMRLLPGRIQRDGNIGLGRGHVERGHVEAINGEEDEEGEEEEVEGEEGWPPRSVLDVHFPPAAMFTQRRDGDTSRDNELRRRESHAGVRVHEDANAENRNGNGREEKDVKTKVDRRPSFVSSTSSHPPPPLSQTPTKHPSQALPPFQTVPPSPPLSSSSPPPPLPLRNRESHRKQESIESTSSDSSESSEHEHEHEHIQYPNGSKDRHSQGDDHPRSARLKPKSQVESVSEDESARSFQSDSDAGYDVRYTYTHPHHLQLKPKPMPLPMSTTPPSKSLKSPKPLNSPHKRPSIILADEHPPPLRPWHEESGFKGLGLGTYGDLHLHDNKRKGEGTERNEREDAREDREYEHQRAVSSALSSFPSFGIGGGTDTSIAADTKHGGLNGNNALRHKKPTPVPIPRPALLHHGTGTGARHNTMESHGDTKGKGKRKGKKVAWDKTVQGGESPSPCRSLSDDDAERCCDSASYSKINPGIIPLGGKERERDDVVPKAKNSRSPYARSSQCHSGQAEPRHNEPRREDAGFRPNCDTDPTKRSSSLLAEHEHVATIWRRIVPPPRDDEEILDLYRVDLHGTHTRDPKDEESRIDKEEEGKTGVEGEGKGEREAKTIFTHPSLAVPGRYREKEIGGVNYRNPLFFSPNSAGGLDRIMDIDVVGGSGSSSNQKKTLLLLLIETYA
ncbi:hypothetical protein F5Y03DRAFT_401105 [Xylaria venustula]|nr:hypothetical protein F5Y03DRAFT_401105 [Xylaria venustula]